MNQTQFVLDQFVGRFHPVLVHLPIGFLLLLALLELLALRPNSKHLSNAGRVILIVSVPVTLAAALTGWLLAGAGGYNDAALFQHRWAGVAVAVGTVALLIVHQRHQVRLYRWLLGMVVLLVGLAGHQGGTLTHGSGYLGKFAPGPLRGLLGGGQPIAPADGSVLATVIQPIFDRNCISCHNADKVKGGLRLDTYDLMLKGGDNGPVMVAGKSAESELLLRTRLPIADDDHMPPDGKPQPTTDELAVLAWWIDAGAPPNKTVADLNPSEAIQRILATLGRMASRE